MYARLSTVRARGGDIGEGRTIIRDQILPAARELGGFQGVISIGDAASGTWRTITLWDTEEDMRASEERATELRRRAAEAVGATAEPEVERYEVVYLEVESGVRVS
jgi:heme-degrading monooxygenase HmoA